MLRRVNSDDFGHGLSTTFDLEAERYHRIRPAPPAALLDAMLEQGHLKPDDRVLEVGCGSGQATRPLAERGLKVHALELGPELATLAHRNLAGFPNVTV
jgi:protein-L-isoaspartate O-methyltransferase